MSLTAPEFRNGRRWTQPCHLMDDLTFAGTAGNCSVLATQKTGRREMLPTMGTAVQLAAHRSMRQLLVASPLQPQGNC